MARRRARGDGLDEQPRRKKVESQPCGLCGRLFLRFYLYKPHCLLRQTGATQADVELICSQCHGMIHATYANTTLAELYPTIAQLRRAPELASFLKWVRKQPSVCWTKNAPRRRKL
jgi:hypothetical protein